VIEQIERAGQSLGLLRRNEKQILITGATQMAIGLAEAEVSPRPRRELAMSSQPTTRTRIRIEAARSGRAGKGAMVADIIAGPLVAKLGAQIGREVVARYKAGCDSRQTTPARCTNTQMDEGRHRLTEAVNHLARFCLSKSSSVG